MRRKKEHDRKDQDKTRQDKTRQDKTVIPIVFAVDNNGVKFLSVALISLLENKPAETFYDIYVLHSEDFAPKSKHITDSVIDKYTNAKINYCLVSDFRQKASMISHITTPTYFRLKLADILPQKYKKALYLDIDTIVTEDLSELFRTELENYYIAGVKAYGHIKNLNNREYYKSIGLNNLSSYINAGVTLWNLQKIRQDNMTEKLCELSKKDFKSMDQDIINLAFYGHVKILPLKYNFMTWYISKIDKHNAIMLVDYVDEKVENPVIIHYANKDKPWNLKRPFLSEQWYQYAKMSPFRLIFIRDLLYEIICSIFHVKWSKTHVNIKFLGIKFNFRRLHKR